MGQTDQMDQTFGIFEIFEVFEAFEEATMAQMHQNLDSDEENVIFEAFAVFEELHLAQTHKIRNSDEDIEVSCGHMFLVSQGRFILVQSRDAKKQLEFPREAPRYMWPQETSRKYPESQF